MENFYSFLIELFKGIQPIGSPVIIARTLYVFFSMLYNSLSFFRKYKSTKTTRDFPTHNVIINDSNEAFVALIEYTFNRMNGDLFNITLDFAKLFPIVNTYKYGILKKSVYYKRMTEILNTYYVARDNDGWRQINAPRPLPYNKTLKINQVQDLSGIDKWIPLEFPNGRVQTPLNPSAENVSHVLDNPTNILDEYERYFNMISDEERHKEYLAVYHKSLNLTDKEKIIAEYWAGGPSTLKPPGFWNIFMYAVCKNKKLDFVTAVHHFFLLNASLFETALCAWNQKYKHFQERPIAHIRRTVNEPISNFYFPEITTSRLWLPYQERDFVTPPFPDFVSGHSSFSGAGCEVMTQLFNDDLLDLDLHIDGSLMYLLSPIFEHGNCDEVVDLTCINIYPKSSTTIPTVPAQMVTLRYNSWMDMAIEAGISRIYGGIHLESSNYPGLQVGKIVSKRIIEQFQ
jgi:hypothetical protein